MPAAVALIGAALLSAVQAAQGRNPPSLPGRQDLPARLGLRSGSDIYKAACAACHGPGGDGTPEAEAGFTQPDTFPHFDRCDETTPESTRDWTAIIRDGGPARGFSQIMPSFGTVLTPAQINEVVAYLRSLCKEPGWPVGELNVPRALVTEKAFPESETVLTSAANTRGPAMVNNELDYEKTLGRRDQLEVAIPFGWAHQENGAAAGGLGDVAVGVKHVVFAGFGAAPGGPRYEGTGSILSVQAEVSLPTGSVDRGLGTGQTALGAFAAYDRLLPGNTFLQLQGGVDVPLHEGPAAAFLRAALGKSFNTSGGFGRMWTPLLELVGDRDLTSGAATDWDVVPELQITLNRRQHIRAAVGYRIPVSHTSGRPGQVMAYILWDWFDGGLLEGWR